MTEQNKDYSLLKPFDLEAAKDGEPICTWTGCQAFFIGINQKGCTVVEGDCGSPYPYLNDNLRMAPLAWVEGKPVYVGDVLYTNVENIAPHPNGVRVTGIYPNGNLIWESIGDDRKSIDGYSMHILTWTKPKVKREGWMNIYGYGCTVIHPTKAEADFNSTSDRIDCIHVKWEEQ